MDISCEVIRDLLPLYAEDLTSEESNKLVDEHLCQCDPCTKQLAILKKAAQLPVDLDTGALKRVGDTIRRRRILAVLTVVLFVVTLGMSAAMLLDAKIYLTAEQAVQSAEQRDNGDVVIYLNDCVIGMGATQHKDSGNYGTVAWSNLSRLLFHPERVSYEDLSPEIQAVYSEEEYETVGRFILGGAEGYNIWYCDAGSGKAETLLIDAGKPVPTGALLDVNYYLAYYCVILAAIAVLFAIPGWKFSGKWYGELCFRLAILLGSLSLSAVIVSAGQFMERYGDFTEHIIDSTAVAIPMTLTGLFAHRLYRLNKQDKGE